MALSSKKMVDFLAGYISKNKGIGINAQLLFEREFKSGDFSQFRDRFFDGAWILAPKVNEAYRLRTAFFIHDACMRKDLFDMRTVPETVLNSDKMKIIAGYLIKAGINVFYSLPVCSSDASDATCIEWKIFWYEPNGRGFRCIDTEQFFKRWPGRGRVVMPKQKIDEGILQEMKDGELMKFFLRESFVIQFLKRKLKKSTYDLYDVDAFLIDFLNFRVFPVEIKEKFPAGGDKNKYFGIDAGRILMLLRLTLPNRSNAFYVIREVEEGSRAFKSWKYITLSDIIMKASWNLTGGGPSMSGGRTQTINIPYSAFEEFTTDVFDREYLARIADMTEDVAKKAQAFIKNSAEWFRLNDSQDS